MPTSMLACLLALALAGTVAAATPALLRWCPLPPDAEEMAPYSELATARFRWAVFGTAAVAGSLAFLLTDPRYWAAWAPLVTLGAVLGLVDLRTTYLPLRLNYLALVLALVGAAVAAVVEGSWRPLLSAGATGAIAAALFWLVWRFSGGRLGFGDVRLAGLLGAVTGTVGMPLPVWSFLLGSLVGGVWGAVVWIRHGRDSEFAYGPALLLGPLLALVLSWALQPG